MAVTPLIAIIGRPNVGKSSLFNRLVGRRQAIVHETAGTTRDANYGNVEWGGRYFMLVDTAGLQKSANDIESQVQDQLAEVADIAAVLLVVVDAGSMLTNEDRQAAKLALKTGKPVILVANKIDTAAKGLVDALERLGVKQIMETSAIHGQGTGDLLDEITKLVEAAPKPDDAEPGVKLALLGRPNVGKSSLLNALVGKQQAVVSDTPGTTRDVATARVRYHNETITLLDTAGLRRRGKIERGVEKFSALRTMAAIGQADVCAIVMDADELAVAGDQAIAGMVLEAGKGLILVVNKWDVVEKETGTQERLTRRLMRDFAFAPWAPLVYTSATHGLNITKLFGLALEIAERRTIQVPTGELNRIVSPLLARQPPAGLKGKRPKIKYATQTGHKPPTFTFFSSYPDLVHFSYKRYLENGLRAAHDFSGTPIFLEFSNK